MKRAAVPSCHIDHPETWIRYHRTLCQDCRGTCCSLPVEVRVDDLVTMGLVDPFEAAEAARQIARRLEKAGLIDHFNARNEIFTLARRANADCIFLDPQSRLCTIYAQRPATCRNHPQIGPRPGFCAYQARGI